jgi:hypothetical protein
MSEDKHTPEPWRGQHRLSGWTPLTSSAVGAPARILSAHDYYRACACVNACKGIPNAALGAGVVRELLAACETALLGIESLASRCPLPAAREVAGNVKLLRGCNRQGEGRHLPRPR